jgi:hypothetical protein
MGSPRDSVGLFFSDKCLFLKSFVRNYLTSLVGTQTDDHPLKRPIFASDVAVQTDTAATVSEAQPATLYDGIKHDIDDEFEESILSASDLASILKWSKEISSDINLSSGTPQYVLFLELTSYILALQRLTEICTGWLGVLLPKTACDL